MLSQQLVEARRTGVPIVQLTSQIGKFDETTAYLIQEDILRSQINRGEVLIGWKMGLTSEAKRKQMNLSSSLYGYLTNEMELLPQEYLSLKSLIHPKAEPEIAFKMSQDVPPYSNYETISNSIESACISIEIIDSRYTEFKYFTMEDVISDNSSSGRFIFGSWKPWEEVQKIDLCQIELDFRINNQSIQKGKGEAISGNPLHSLVQLSALLAKQNRMIQKNQVILAGAATAAEVLKPGMTVSLNAKPFESVEFKVIE